VAERKSKRADFFKMLILLTHTADLAKLFQVNSSGTQRSWRAERKLENKTDETQSILRRLLPAPEAVCAALTVTWK
jgi:hypothetical protein